MSDLVAVALVNGVFAVLVLVLGVRLNGKVNRVRAQVENDHPKNLRVEQDERHSENSGKLDAIMTEIARLARYIDRLFERTDRHTDQIHDLEMTQPRHPANPRRRK